MVLYRRNLFIQRNVRISENISTGSLIRKEKETLHSLKIRIMKGTFWDFSLVVKKTMIDMSLEAGLIENLLLKKCLTTARDH